MSEAEKPEPKTGKRIVSKGQYVRQVMKRSGVVHAALVVVLLSFLCGVGGFCGLALTICSAFWLAFDSWDRLLPLISLGVTLILGGVSRILWLKAMCMLDCWHSMEVGVPLTRANAADLPAPDSLVRASVEPMQAQETILLRAAAQGQQTPAEQLVRPAGGQE